jgi:hypothetical protein
MYVQLYAKYCIFTAFTAYLLHIYCIFLHNSCIFTAYSLHFFLHISCIFDLLKVHLSYIVCMLNIAIILHIFCMLIQFYCIFQLMVIFKVGEIGRKRVAR